ncbi:MAG: hypothetical protein QOF33_234 [Thermomicrobiales bacterium]|jgi:hypothetical protein|nr:hypothetical protein [Thermomicrobiales bacterium]
MNERIPRPQDISWLLDLYDKGQLDLEPPYQRKSVWSPSDRRFFIDTIMNNYPSPAIFLHRTLDEQGRPTYHVVDGKQRLQTIINFRLNKIRITDDFSDANLQGKRWKDLGKQDRDRFWNYVIVVEMLPDVDDPYVRNVFDRINRNARKLTQQELRHAKYDGWFITTAETEANKEEWREFGIVTTARAKRMLDVQFISELMAIIINGDIHGFDHDFLDDIYAQYDDIEDQATFVEEDFTESLEGAKKYILDMLEFASEISPFIRFQNHFYTLWGYLILESSDRPSAAELAPRYRQFLVEVDSMLKNPLVEDILENIRSSEDDAVLDFGPLNMEARSSVVRYAANIRGANTELAQRRMRHNALVEAMAGAEAAADENQ